MKASAFIATSLDGFIARPDGAIDWLEGPESVNGDDYGYREFMATVDFLVMGRRTFEKVLGFGEWSYGTQPVVVLSSRPLAIPDELAGTVEGMSCAPVDVVSRLAERGAEHLYVDGGVTIQRFLAAGLIHRLIITRIPVLIGTGIALFGPVSADVVLKHVGTRSFSNGLVQSEYEVSHGA